MNNEEAKAILSCFRPGTEDEHDPMFAEALAQAQNDPELSAWLKEQKAFDGAVSSKLAASSLPQNLLADIQAGVAARRSGRSRNLYLALAASVVLVGAIAAVWLNGSGSRDNSQFAACRAYLVDYLKKFPRLDLETERLSRAREWLAETHHLQQIEIPAGLEKFPTIGCRTLEWHGQKLALVCFMVDGEVVHLILIPETAIPDGPTTSQPQFARVGKMSTVAWRKGDLTYLVLSKAGQKFLRERI